MFQINAFDPDVFQSGAVPMVAPTHAETKVIQQKGYPRNKLLVPM